MRIEQEMWGPSNPLRVFGLMKTKLYNSVLSFHQPKLKKVGSTETHLVWIDF